MPFSIINGDITKTVCDAIVNAANPSLLGGGGVDGAIHAAAGHDLVRECMTLGGCEPGDAKLTSGYGLPCRYVIHTVGPIWEGGNCGEPEILASCYRKSLSLAAERGCASVAFPLISAGAYGYPRREAFGIALREIKAFLNEEETGEMTVYLVIYGDRRDLIGKDLSAGIGERLEERENMGAKAAAEPMPVYGFDGMAAEAARPERAKRKSLRRIFRKEECCQEAAEFRTADATAGSASLTGSGISEALKMIDESFSQMLLRKIDEKGMTDAECYKKANIDRKLFSKIRSDMHYRPSKSTVLAFAIALELPLAETKEMLMKAGFALSPSSVSDIIVEYFIRTGNYDIYEINGALFEYDQTLLG
ncbi:MAG: macro domain-containing protein [Clostridia bacterium]|nr:macro domain-containing protein [Clostridia bacterium]